MQAGSTQQGISLIEAAIVVAVLAITLGTALPSLAAFIEHLRLGGVAATLATDLQSARTEAVARNTKVRITFHESAAGSCYILHTGAAEDCRCVGGEPAVCEAGSEAIKTVWLAAEGGIAVRAKARSMLSDPLHGTSTPANTVRVLDRHGHAIHHVVNMMGRLSSCSPDGAVRGYGAC